MVVANAFSPFGVCKLIWCLGMTKYGGLGCVDKTFSPVCKNATESYPGPKNGGMVGVQVLVAVTLL